MKKLLFFLVFAICLLSLASPSYALLCKMGQGPGGSDECWTEIETGTGYMTLVSKGHVMVVSTSGVAVQNGKLARLAGASTDQAILGVAQGRINSGDSALILAKGKGVVRFHNATGSATAGLATGDVLAVHTSGTVAEPAAASHYGRAYHVATALEITPDTSVNEEQNLDAYINVL